MTADARQAPDAGQPESRGVIAEAVKGLEYAINHPLAKAAEKARMEALLSNKDLIRGLRSRNTEIRSAAAYYQGEIERRLRELAP